MIWLAIRQFRLQALIAVAALAALAVLVAVLGAQLLSDYHATVTDCAAHADCLPATTALVNRFDRWNTWFGVVALVVPGLLGIFWGAPLLARELETGTFRLAWTQSISRSRWTLTKLGLLGLASMAAAGLCSLFVTWWASPLDQIGAGPFTTFDQRGIVPVGYALFAFALGRGGGRRHPPHVACDGSDVGRLRHRPAGCLRVGATPLHGTAAGAQPVPVLRARAAHARSGDPAGWVGHLRVAREPGGARGRPFGARGCCPCRSTSDPRA